MSIIITTSKAFVRAPGLRPRALQEILEGQHPGVTAEALDDPTEGRKYIKITFQDETVTAYPTNRSFNVAVTEFVWEQARYFLASARFAAYLRSMTPEERQVVGFSA